MTTTNPWQQKAAKQPTPASGAKPTPKPGHLMVQVRSRDNDRPVGAAKVKVSGPKAQNASTHRRTGDCSFSEMPPGEYSVEVTESKFEPASTKALVREVAPPETTEIKVTLTPKLRVTVRSSFVNPGEGECWVPGEAIAKAAVLLEGKSATDGGATTSAVTVNAGVAVTGTPRSANLPSKWATKKDRDVGQVLVSLAKVADGDHILRIVPDSSMTSQSPAGPTTKDSGTRAYRPFEVRVTVNGGKLTNAVPVPPDDGHGHVTGVGSFELAVDFKPDWIRAPRHGGVRKSISCIVIHHTGGPIIGAAVNEFLSTVGDPKSIHYMVDIDGHVVKFVEDDTIAFQAGFSRWGRTSGLNSTSIGIEIVNRSGPFAEAQYASLIALLKTLVAAHGVAPHQILGHSDVATQKPPGDTTLLSRKEKCPGREFDWVRLEKEGLGWVLTQVELGNYYGGYFSSEIDEVMRKGDSDSKQTYGGKKRTDFPPTDYARGPIHELQEDLTHIGYSLHVNGDFDEHTRMAVDRFQRHCFSGSRREELPDSKLGILDARTANMIKTARGSLP